MGLAQLVSKTASQHFSPFNTGSILKGRNRSIRPIQPSPNDGYFRIVFSNGSRAGPSSGCRRFRVPAFSACSSALDGVSLVQGG